MAEHGQSPAIKTCSPVKSTMPLALGNGTCSRADVSLKTTGTDARLVLNPILLRVCIDILHPEQKVTSDGVQMSSMSMSMPTSTLIAMSMTSTMSMATASASPSSGMSMGGSSCKISMTWNWYTVGACFISKSWQVTSGGIFALSCIGVILLVISLEFLRRVQREYDGWIRRTDQKTSAIATATRHSENGASASYEQVPDSSRKTTTMTGASLPERPLLRRRPVDRMTLLQRQFVRSLIHMVQFGVAYFVMLLAMYYNGYIIICIIIGAFLGCFIFSWDQLLTEPKEKPEAADITGCCG
ncbi:uncharacterized protein PV07_10715 [Cladophialophora immunda]|uniref:Copper transport protein n=1 Tax=Cladophialophora immunda TaxID=569365 RepID=A0A0D2AJK5_9EURO|nr:uncharacterized protein PV07_10715 [Cladophialophora immunda]KIW25042.1 hypothetical protein PV07_10715 [Cladophialophora immunda]